MINLMIYHDHRSLMIIGMASAIITLLCIISTTPQWTFLGAAIFKSSSLAEIIYSWSSFLVHCYYYYIFESIIIINFSGVGLMIPGLL